MPSCRRRRRSIMSSLPRLLLLWAAVLIGVVLQGDGAVAGRRLLRGIAEPPTPDATAAGPAAVAQPGGGEGTRHDRSVAGAEVILAGFAAAVTVIVFCYIRVTRKRNGSVVQPVGKPESSLGGLETSDGLVNK